MLNPMFDLLLVVEPADEEGVVAEGDEAVVEALDDGFVAGFDVDDAALAVDGYGVAADGVAVVVVPCVGVE